ncbi:serine hydrolase domain-containing protein [Amycolatopsis ultiminotia]|uniref:Serine hydrolase domain-containing protein n=1 Tax=Amycolatopsis ultiminotia TaxID=543629 RepID=A0ABP6V4V6_9PSEU
MTSATEGTGTAGRAPASGLTQADLAGVVDDVMAEHGTAAFTAAVLTGDRIIQAARGLANPELGIPMTEESLVQIGSTTKLFNATLVLRLVEEGKLDLDQPIREIVDGFRLADPAATGQVTVRHCLSMTSGIDGGPFTDLGYGTDVLARYVAGLAGLPHLFPPGGGFSYSNAGCVAAGRAAEVVTGRCWDDLVRDYVFDPAGMTDTETTVERLLFKRYAVGISPDGTVIRPWTPSRALGPAGSTCAATAADLVRFARNFLPGAQNDGGGILSAESVARMTEPVVDVATGFPADQWGLGVGISRTPTYSIFGHPGFNLSGCSILWWVPELDVALACATNKPSAYGDLVDCAGRILERLGGSRPALPQPAPRQEEVPAGVDGAYECGAARFEVQTDGDGELVLNLGGQGVLAGHRLTTKLVPAGRHGYLPDQPLQPGLSYPTAVAFAEYAGVPVLVIGNAARKVEEQA